MPMQKTQVPDTDDHRAEQIKVVPQPRDTRPKPKVAKAVGTAAHQEPEYVPTDSFQAYIGGELYNKRMFPHGCPSYQKAFVKLFKVQKGRKKMTLIDTQFFNNRDGFGYIMRNLTRGEYQI